MEKDFWKAKWVNNEIPFHESKANPLLVAHFDKLKLRLGSRVFLPLCGKTLDIAWLLAQGVKVCGAELSKIAVEQLFAELGVQPNITSHGPISRYSAPNVDLMLGDMFDVSGELLGPVDAVYDRAALVALPCPMRDRYTQHLSAITNRAAQLLVTFDYDQTQMDGPPFSIDRDEVYRHYNQTYEITLLQSQAVVGGLKGICEASEHIWLLDTKT